MPRSVRSAFLDALDVQPDPFQLQAMAALDEGRSVLVMAPTGSGKTFVADYAVARAVDAGTRAIYTTPLKALSNQKHRDLSARLGASTVGLITGDRVVNPGAPVLVVTTEVLRAMLYDGAAALSTLGAVILDEFHYLQDVERGAAWEEVVIHTPAHVPLVCLSATIPDVEAVHSWLVQVHGPTELVVAAERPVKLNHLYAIGNLHHATPLLLPVFLDEQMNSAAELLDGARRDTRGDGLRARDRDRPVPPERGDLIAHLRANDLAPIIWFVLSRAGCDSAVVECVESGLQLTDEAERVRIRALVSQALAPLSAGELRAIDAGRWQQALEAGVAAHHGGLAPVQREVVEAAFAEGLVKVAFATETLALGVNLPARTVVIDRVVRASGELLTAGEFAQLAGRAGRRGIDEVGHVVVPWSSHVPFHRVAALAGGHLAAIRSAFRVTPAMAANLVRICTPASAVAAVESSLRQHRALDHTAVLRTDLALRRAELEALGPEVAVASAPVAPAAPKRDDVLAAVSAGDVVVDSGAPARGPVVVLAVGRKRGAAYVEAIGSNGRRVQLTTSSLRGRPTVVGRLDLPEWEPTRRGHAQRAADALAQFEVPDVPVEAPPANGRPPKANGQRRRLVESIASLSALLTENTTGVRDELDRMIRLLERRGHVVNWTLTESGQAVRRLFHPSGLLLAECIAAGVMDDLDAPSLASAASWFTVRSRLGAPPSTGIATPELASRWTLVRDVTRSVQADELACGLPPTQHPEPALGVPLHRWASGAALDVALAGSGVLVGDVVREVRQVAELLEQVLTVPGKHQATAEQAVLALRRGAIVADDR
ncbi:DEAD/DEAH box helicase [Tenggerimyces flavus]|uniref:DEAD/DEAH box helicase n=1 Tax=Tenggerimyces flavus TaxID=1708749 RepID=A0ABV7Y707_9ACTN|nr:DEAD/DEAH box helicase [Tenggerimyces flavus]MBM7785002.1 ATP-dependent RNA helicase HelY [Tenggerimyces flavus]